MRPIVIAHRGASGYLPEHTLEAKRLAFEQGADYLEQDIVATADDQLVVLHDVYLDRVTDVATRFAGRERDNGRYYVRDFSLAELRELRVWERLRADGTAVYPQRYPTKSGDFRINTFAEELDFIAQLNHGGQRRAGIYPEIKRPAWHKAQGVDIAPLLQSVLIDAGYEDHASPVYVQCFDAAELERLRRELGYPWRLVQLIGNNAWQEAPTDFGDLQSPEGLARVAEFAEAIGPWLELLYVLDDRGRPRPTELVAAAHDHGLAVHAFTFRRDDLPPGFTTLQELVSFSTEELRVDGMFTDFPDLLRNLQ